MTTVQAPQIAGDGAPKSAARKECVAIACGLAAYDVPPPFSPAVAFPEYPFAGAGALADANEPYRLVREAFRLLGMDRSRFMSAHWNPLGGVVCPGDTVVLKPNFVRDFRETQAGHADCLITHGSVLRAVLDYAYVALQGCGRLVIADAPQNDADFGAIRRMAGLDEIREFYRTHAGFDVEVYDLRPEQARKIDGVVVGHVPLRGDPAGYVRVNLGRDSAFTEVNHLCSRLYGAEYDTAELRRHHHDGIHEYLISRTVLEADCVIGLPKLKTHKKTGLTVCLKNLVGINGSKNWLPHHREGTPAEGGDQFDRDGLKSRLECRVMASFRRLFPLIGPLQPVLAGPLKAIGTRVFGDTNRDRVRSGNWYGNDTTWRMVLDLNRITLYSDTDGSVHRQPVRRAFHVVDGIVAGEGNGPLDPAPKPTGVILAGLNPLAVDLMSARLMGFDHRRVPMLRCALEDHLLPLSGFGWKDVTGVSNDKRFAGRIAELQGRCLKFRPHFGWEGYVEVAEVDDEMGVVA